MRSFIVLVFALFINAVQLVAQITDENKRTDYYIGLQANQLIRQIISLGGGAVAVSPYVLNFSATNTSTGWGVTVGYGHDRTQTKIVNAFSNTESETSDVNFRVGLDKKLKLSDRWTAGYSLDLLFFNDKITSINETSFGSNQSAKAETSGSESGWGFGPRANLLFHVNKRIVLGTESTYYARRTIFKSTTKNTNRFLEFDPNMGQQRLVTSINTTKEDFNTFNMNLNVPVLIFLFVKF